MVLCLLGGLPQIVNFNNACYLEEKGEEEEEEEEEVKFRQTLMSNPYVYQNSSYKTRITPKWNKAIKSFLSGRTCPTLWTGHSKSELCQNEKLPFRQNKITAKIPEYILITMKTSECRLRDVSRLQPRPEPWIELLAATWANMPCYDWDIENENYAKMKQL